MNYFVQNRFHATKTIEDRAKKDNGQVNYKSSRNIHGLKNTKIMDVFLSVTR